MKHVKTSGGVAYIDTDSGFFSRIYKFLATSAVTAVALPYVYLICLKGLDFSRPAAFLMIAAAVALGYGLQAVYGKVARVTRLTGSAGYESEKNPFMLKHAALPVAAAFALQFIVAYAVRRLLVIRAASGVDEFYDSHSLWPLLLSAAFFLLELCGIVSWFYPYYRLVSMKSVFFSFFALLICFFLSLSDPAITTVCAAIYLVCALIILNQTKLISSVGRSGNGVITPDMRLYNLALTAFLLLAAAAMTVGVIAALVGVVVLARMAGYMLLAGMFRDSDAYAEQQDVANAVDEGVFNLKKFGIENRATGKTFFYIFCVVILLVTLFLIIARRRNVFVSIAGFFGAIYRNLIEFLTNLFRLSNPVKRDYYQYADYRDFEKTKTRQQITEEKAAEPVRPAVSYRDFERKISAFRTYGEKYNFAYNALVGCWKKMGFSLCGSDTPRQIKAKIDSHAEIKATGPITDEFERVKYGPGTADTVPEGGETVSALDAVCVLVKKYIEQG